MCSTNNSLSSRSLRVSRPLVLAVGLLPVAVAFLGAQTLPPPDRFDRVLARHVHDGLVDYEGLKADRADLDRYLERLGEVAPMDLTHATRDDRLAFWINAYNACVLRLVIDHYPLAGPQRANGASEKHPASPPSIRQIPHTWTAPFCRVARRDRSLDGIESGILRPIGDPRIHFALSCAARGCPALADQAYRADRLDEQLDRAVRRFVADPRQCHLEPGEPPVLHINKFLDWYKEDFGGATGLVAFLRRYVPRRELASLRPGAVRVEYLDFDWSLNEAEVPDSAR